MSRVSENSSSSALNFAINKTKRKLENLQIKGSNLKNITRPSDNPLANVKSLSIGSAKKDNEQYLRNSNYAMMHLNTTESSLAQIADILVKAKEIAITQSSDFYDGNIRKNVANEVQQLRNQALAISNRRVGNKFIFGGYSTLKKPFNDDGTYTGDTGKINVEVAKDFFVPVNVHGKEAFFVLDDSSSKIEHPLKQFPEVKNEGNMIIDDKMQRAPASINPGPEENQISSKDQGIPFEKRENLFSVLDGFLAALENNDAEYVRNLLPKFDGIINRIITLRTKVGAVTNSVATSISAVESENLDNAAQNSKLVDADIASLFSDITKQQNILKTTYKSGQSTLNQNLLDFLK